MYLLAAERNMVGMQRVKPQDMQEIRCSLNLENRIL
jgi:hypothetical protein